MESANFVILLLAVLIVMSGATWAYQTYTSAIQQQNAAQQGQVVIKQINDKLDELHKQSQIQINAQGNLSQHTRDKLIQEFGSVADKGGFATEQGQKQLLNNVTVLLHGGNTPTLAAKLSMQNQLLLKDILHNMTGNKTK